MDVSQEGGISGLTAAKLNPSLEAASKQLNRFAAQQAEQQSDIPVLEELPQ